MASEKAGLDERKGETLEDMSGLVHQLTLKATVTDIRYHSLGLYGRTYFHPPTQGAELLCDFGPDC